MKEYISLTTYIPHTVITFNDAMVMKISACWFKGSRYTAAIMNTDLRTHYTGCKRIDRFKEWCKDDNVLHAVLYIYHERKNEFEIVKTY